MISLGVCMMFINVQRIKRLHSFNVCHKININNFNLNTSHKNAKIEILTKHLSPPTLVVKKYFFHQISSCKQFLILQIIPLNLGMTIDM